MTPMIMMWIINAFFSPKFIDGKRERMLWCLRRRFGVVIVVVISGCVAQTSTVIGGEVGQVHALQTQTVRPPFDRGSSGTITTTTYSDNISSNALVSCTSSPQQQ